jgi:hypothetical protein
MPQWNVLVIASTVLLLACTGRAGAQTNPFALRIVPRPVELPQRKISDGLKKYLAASCKLEQSTKSVTNEANELLKSARNDLSEAADEFESASKNIGASIAVVVNEQREDVQASLAVLKARRYEVPRSFGDLYAVLATVVRTESTAVEKLGYEDNIAEFNATARLVLVANIRTANLVSALGTFANTGYDEKGVDQRQNRFR